MFYFDFQVYEKAQFAMVRDVHNERINLIAFYTEGDRTGHVHIGYNQTLFIGMIFLVLLRYDARTAFLCFLVFN